jgi:pSer/pThr/pTyr-binding forkhead associated (FHA) protein
MAKVIVRLNDSVIGEVELKPGDMSIGRRAGSDIHLDAMSVSGTHASIYTAGSESYLQDMNSTNGTFINERRVTKQRLSNGDVVAIGKHTLTYIADAGAPDSPDLAKTVVIRPRRGADAAPKAPPMPATPAPRMGSLFVLSGGGSGKRVDLNKPVTNLGSAGKTAGIINRSSSGSYTLVPGENSAAPRVNGVAIAARGAQLHNGDVIEVSGARMQFHFK